MDLDESSCFLDKDEKKDVEDAQRDSCAAAASLQAFRSEFRRHRAETRAAAPAPKAAGKRAKPGAAAPRFGKYPALPATMLTQPEAKALLPPRGAIWRGLSNGSWNVHVPPFKRRSFAWSIYGPQEAALMCLRFAWEVYLESEGLTTEACPVEGLFLATAAVAVTKVGAASSSSDRKRRS